METIKQPNTDLHLAPKSPQNNGTIEDPTDSNANIVDPKPDIPTAKAVTPAPLKTENTNATEYLGKQCYCRLAM